MSFRWGEDTTVKFVTKYLEHECLWNVKSSLYKNKPIKQSAYVDLENAMNIPGFGEKEIKLKIKNIRLVFSPFYLLYHKQDIIQINIQGVRPTYKFYIFLILV